MTVVAQQPGPVAPTFVCWDVVAAQVVACRTTDQEVPSSIPTASRAFFSSLSYHSQVSILKTGPSWRWNTTDFQLANKK